MIETSTALKHVTDGKDRAMWSVRYSVFPSLEISKRGEDNLVMTRHTVSLFVSSSLTYCDQYEKLSTW